LRVVQAGWVELHEFHVGHTAPGPPSHRDAVPRRAIRIARVQIGLAGTTGGQYDMTGCNRAHGPVPYIQDISTQGPVGVMAQFRGGHQVDGHVVFQNGDPGRLTDLGLQRGLYGPSGGIRSMSHAPVAMATFAGQVQGRYAVYPRSPGERDAALLQPFDSIPPAFHHEPDRLLAAQARPGVQRVGDMGIDRVGGVQDGGNAALGIQRAAFLQRALGKDGHLHAVRQAERQRQARGPTADDQYIESGGLAHGWRGPALLEWRRKSRTIGHIRELRTRMAVTATGVGVPRMGKQSADQVLVERVQGGDRSAFDLLVLKYQHRIVKLVSRYVFDHSEAQDVAQEAFLKAWRALPGFRGESAFYTWLYRIAINTAKNHLVSQSRRPVMTGADPQDPEQYELAGRLADNDTPERLLLTDEIGQAILRTIDELPDELRTAILLREVEGLSYEEISQAMECPIGTVRSRIFRAREAVDERIKPLMDP
jgi:RNA polymerase sigma-70 factor, ECF subfamily